MFICIHFYICVHIYMSPTPQTDPAGVKPNHSPLTLSHLEGARTIAVGTFLSTELLYILYSNAYIYIYIL